MWVTSQNEMELALLMVDIFIACTLSTYFKSSKTVGVENNGPPNDLKQDQVKSMKLLFSSLQYLSHL